MNKTAYIDRILRIAGILVIVLLFALPSYYYSSLPERIPVNFNPAGEINQMTSKAGIWRIPVMASVFFIFVEIMIFFIPAAVNYFDKLDEKKEKYLRLGIQSLKILNLLFASIFLYVTYSIIRTAAGEWAGISERLTNVVFSALFVLVVFFAYRFVKMSSV